MLDQVHNQMVKSMQDTFTSNQAEMAYMLISVLDQGALAPQDSGMVP